MVTNYAKIALLSVFVFFITTKQSYGAAVYICFSYKDINFDEIKKQENMDKLAIAIKNNDDDAILYYMKTELAYLNGNQYEKGTKAYRLKQKAIFWDAILGNDINEVNEYIKSGGNLNHIYPTDYFFTPLMAASRCGYKDIVQTLIEAGADVNKEGSLVGTYDSMIRGVTALSQAERQEHDEVVEILLKAGAVRKKTYIERVKIAKPDENTYP